MSPVSPARLVRAGHWPSLVAALLHFEVGFAVWVLIGVLGPYVAEDLALSPGVTGVMVALPLLAGAAFRVLLGTLADAYGPRRVGTASMLLVLVPLGWAWLAGDTLAEMLLIGALLGIAGGSFAIAMPLASAHYPPSHRGLALGIVGAGNSGTIIAALAAPRIAETVGWRATFGLALAPVALVALAFRLLAREVPGSPAAARRRSPLRERECRRLCRLYAITFGSYVGLAAFLPLLLVDGLGVSAVAAGTVAAGAAGAGSLMRPVGGLLADRIGGLRVLACVLAVVPALAVAVSTMPALPITASLLVLLLATLGVGNGSVMQVVARRYPDRVGAVSGFVGAAGGLGGFLLPTLLGVSRQASGSFAAGFWLLAVVALAGLAPLLEVRVRRPVVALRGMSEEAA